jgi:long-chain fatty acid transport protein
MKTLWKSILLGQSILWAGSVYGPIGVGQSLEDRFGSQQSMQSGEAFVSKTDFSLKNHARNSLNSHTTFIGVLDWRSDLATQGDKSTAASTINIPLVGINFLSEDYGSLGLAYVQKTTKDIEYSFSSTKDTLGAIYSGGLTEIQASYAWDYYDMISVGFAGHLKMGTEKRKFDFLKVGDSWTNEVFDANRSSGYQFSFSSQIELAPFAIGARFQPSYELTRETESFWVLKRSADSTAQYIDDTGYQDTVKTNISTTELKRPWNAGLYLSYKMTKHQRLALDAEYSDGGDKYNISQVVLLGENPITKVNPAYFLGLGWSTLGSKRAFAPYFKKMSYKIGLSHKQLAYQEVKESTLAGGLGFPLGRRGSSHIETSFFGGIRKSEVSSDMNETFYGVQVQFSGLAKWGQSRRRRR